LTGEVAEDEDFSLDQLIKAGQKAVNPTDVYRRKFPRSELAVRSPRAELSTVEAACLFSIKHAMSLAKDDSSFNFAAVFSIYNEFIRTHQGVKSYSQTVFQKGSLALRSYRCD
jgi:hypothetical protein